MSGAITWQRGFEENNINMAFELASKLDCFTDLLKLLSCLNQVDLYFKCCNFALNVHEILYNFKKTSQEIIAASTKKFYDCPIMPWVPVVELNFGQEIFFLRRS